LKVYKKKKKRKFSFKIGERGKGIQNREREKSGREIFIEEKEIGKEKGRGESCCHLVRPL